MAKFQKLAALRQFEIFNAIGKRRVPACATDGALSGMGFLLFACWRSAKKVRRFRDVIVVWRGGRPSPVKLRL
jgi:hypothetical protein